MFDDRFRILDEVRQMLVKLMCWSGVSPEQLESFHLAMATAGAVFGSCVAEYSDEIYRRGKLLSGVEMLMREALRAPRVAPQPLRAEIAEIARSQSQWVTDQMVVVGKGKPVYKLRLGL